MNTPPGETNAGLGDMTPSEIANDVIVVASSAHHETRRTVTTQGTAFLQHRPSTSAKPKPTPTDWMGEQATPS